MHPRSVPHIAVHEQLLGTGTLKPKTVNTLLKSYDQRFARNIDMIFLLFNQKMRHEQAQNIYIKLKSGNKDIERLKTLITSPDFIKRLDSAIAAQESIDARKLIKQVWRVVKVTSRNVA